MAKDITPEHTKRMTADDQPVHPDVLAAYDYVESVRDTSDSELSLMWHGWALREAFLAGISHEQRTPTAPSAEDR